MKRLTLLRAFALAALLATAPVPAAENHAHWTYEGAEGPDHWAELDHGFAACGEGRAQSPVNLDTREPLPGALPPITVHYRPVPLDVVNNGHTIQVNVAPGSTILVGDQEYQLVQFHFHAPSEHAFNGKLSDMVIHFVHKSADGRFGVIDLMLDKGAANRELKKIWAHLPKKAGEEVQLPKEMIDPALLLPADLSYVGYTGSLTTPPCTEGVTWMVLTHVGKVSVKQLEKFTALFPHNNRPLQPLNQRPVQLSR
jgi:carbonic anhydrase